MRDPALRAAQRAYGERLVRAVASADGPVFPRAGAAAS
jgi:hypothetical protein